MVNKPFKIPSTAPTASSLLKVLDWNQVHCLVLVAAVAEAADLDEGQTATDTVVSAADSTYLV